MRACTAVVTEMSFNSSDDENAKYRAEIEFIQASDWEKDLQISLKELLDMNGNVGSSVARMYTSLTPYRSVRTCPLIVRQVLPGLRSKAVCRHCLASVQVH
jgi:hypothetical protein